MPLLLVGLIVLLVATESQAYIGPGAGFAVVTSFFTVFLTSFLAFAALMIWPFRQLLILRKRRSIRGKRKAKRVVVLGLDGLDPDLLKKYLSEGKLPNFKKLCDSGAFESLGTTTPAISPVAWSTFSTGVNPGKHSVFDFYTRNPRNYSPVLSSVRINEIKPRFKFLERFLKKSKAELLRKSLSFWKLLSDHGIFSSVIRVPITFPPDQFYGTCLSAMCAPDIRGTQGSFTYLSARAEERKKDEAVSGTILPIHLKDGSFEVDIPGPPGIHARVVGKMDLDQKRITIQTGRHTFHLEEGVYSPWVRLEFQVSRFKKVKGITRFLATDISDQPEIYLTPINIDPEYPVIPVSFPTTFSMSRAKIKGAFSTLGLAEDTWALNENLISEKAFLDQSYDIFEERRSQLLDSLEKNPDGFIVTVFDTTDRIQHMFYRYLDPDHPANEGRSIETHKHAIEELYVKADHLLSEVVDRLRENDVLMVVSDHGFKTFKWGVNLNTWLWKNGYLNFKKGSNPKDPWFQNVDWSETRAYAYGLSGIFLNLKGREHDGIVLPEQRQALQREIRDKLIENSWARRVDLSQEVFKGPYTKEAPDLLVGFELGYRSSWDSAVGRVSDETVEDNRRRWSGDHCNDPSLVPGVYCSNWKLEGEEKPRIEDIAPTILNLFGISPPAFQDGQVLKTVKPTSGS